MLPKQYRLQDYQEIEKVKKEGKLFQSPFFGLLILKSTEEFPSRFTFSRFAFPRFAFIVSTKLSKRATQRNRIKRLLSEAVKFYLPVISLGNNAVFLAKKNILGKSLVEIKKELGLVFTRVGLIKSSNI